MPDAVKPEICLTGKLLYPVHIGLPAYIQETDGYRRTSTVCCLRRGNAKLLFQLFQEGRNRGFFRHLTADGALAGGGGAGGFLSFPAGQSGGRHRAGLRLGHRGAFPHPCQDQSSCHSHHKNDGRSQLIKLLFLHLVQNSPTSDFVPGLLPRRNRSIISSPGKNFNG